MALGRRRSSLSVAPEAAFGSLDSDGVPDTSGLTFIPVECMRSSISWEGQEQPVFQRDLARSSTGRYAPEVESVYIGGAPVMRRLGSVKVQRPLRCPGSSTIDNVALGMLWRSVMGRTAKAAGASDTVEAAPSPTVNAFQVGTPGDFVIGQMVAININSRLEFSCVTDTGGGTGPITCSPAFSAAPGAGAEVLHCQTYWPQLGPLTFADNPSLAFRVDIVGKRYVAVGCRLSKVSFSLGGDDGRTVIVDEEYPAAWIQDDDASASPSNPTVLSGGYAKFLESYAVYSGSIGTSSPAALSRTAFSPRSWSAELNFNLVATGQSASGLRCAEWEVGDVEAMLKLTVEPVAAMETDRLLQVYRSIVVGNGPCNDAGNGLGIAFPAGFQPNTLLPAVGDLDRVMELEYADGVFGLDTGSTAPADTSFRVGVVA